MQARLGFLVIFVAVAYLGIFVAAPSFAQCTSNELAELLASAPQNFEEAGFSVSISGDTAIVAAYRTDLTAQVEHGSATVFVNQKGTWIEQERLTASDAAAGDFFGYSVAVDGDTAVVGAYTANHSGLSDPGAAYVFVRSCEAWTQQAKLTAADASDLAQFGRAVAINGDTILIGAQGVDVLGDTNVGAAYVYVRNGDTWSQQAWLTAPDGGQSHLFGRSVAISGNSAIVGAPRFETAGGIETGAAYVFVRSGASWFWQTKLIAPDGADRDWFGRSVAIDGDVAVVGADEDDHSGVLDAGSAYVFEREIGTWTFVQQLVDSSPAEADAFGTSVAIDGGILGVGVPKADLPGLTDAGVALTYSLQEGLWLAEAATSLSAAASGDEFGRWISVSGEFLLVGAPFRDHSGLSNPGAAYMLAAACEVDNDGDGVPDGDDVCISTPPGISVDSEGRPLGDIDKDCDTDATDFAMFQLGFSGPLP